MNKVTMLHNRILSLVETGNYLSLLLMKDAAYVKNGNSINTRGRIARINKSGSQKQVSEINATATAPAVPFLPGLKAFMDVIPEQLHCPGERASECRKREYRRQPDTHSENSH